MGGLNFFCNNLLRFSPRHSEISSEALAEAKCAGLPLSDPCPRRRQAPSFGSRGFARLSDPYEISVSLEFLVLLFQDKSTGIEIFVDFFFAVTPNAELPHSLPFLKDQKRKQKSLSLTTLFLSNELVSSE